MYLSDYKDLVSNFAVMTTILQFLSGTLVCKQYVDNRTTAEASPLPFICGVLSAGFWLLYGIMKQDNKIVLVNTIGIALMGAYTAVFIIYSMKKSSVLKQVICMTCLLFFVLGYTITEDNKQLLQDRLGLLSCSLTLVTIASPMSKLMYVLKVKNTECLPFPMILMSFFVCSLWCLYGVIVEDSYLFLPNFIGAVLAVFQLSLFVVYPSSTERSYKLLSPRGSALA